LTKYDHDHNALVSYEDSPCERRSADSLRFICDPAKKHTSWDDLHYPNSDRSIHTTPTWVTKRQTCLSGSVSPVWRWPSNLICNLVKITNYPDADLSKVQQS